MSDARDQGFTLIELVLAIGILIFVIGALSSSIIMGLKVTDETSQRISESREAQIASAFFVNDAQGAVTITVGDVPAYTPCGGPNALLSFEGADYAINGGVTGTVVSYVILDPPTLPEISLDRHRCRRAGPTGSFNEVSRNTVVDSLVGSPIVKCDAAIVSSGPCPSSTQQVEVLFDVCGRNAAGNCVFSASQTFKFSLLAKRRPR